MDEVDVQVGTKIRRRRLELSLSQETVASALGVTFQQLQKYEKGTNRVSVGRLHALCAVLDVKPAYFFEDQTVTWVAEPIELFLANDEDCLSLNRAFNRIADAGLRHAILTLIEHVAGEPRGAAGTLICESFGVRDDRHERLLRVPQVVDR